jgi:hypothetical protein
MSSIVHLVYFTAICHILWPLGLFSGYYLVYFVPFWYFVAKNLATLVAERGPFSSLTNDFELGQDHVHTVGR